MTTIEAKFDIGEKVAVIIDSKLREEFIMEIHVTECDNNGDHKISYIVSNGDKPSPRFVVREYYVAKLK